MAIRESEIEAKLGTRQQKAQRIVSPTRVFRCLRFYLRRWEKEEIRSRAKESETRATELRNRIQVTSDKREP